MCSGTRPAGSPSHSIELHRGLRMQRTSTALLAAVLTALGAHSAEAHHSFAAEFDANSPIELTGTINKIAWAYPHTFFYRDLTTPKGEVGNWALEMGSPNCLMRRGWSRNSMTI